MPYRKKTRKKLSKTILSGLFAGAGSVGAFAIGMAVVGSVSENFSADQSPGPGYTQQSGKQQADAGGSQFDDTPPGENNGEGAEGQGSIDGGPGLGDGSSDGEGDSEGGESSLPGNDQVATGEGRTENQGNGNNGGNSSGDNNSSGGTGGSSGGGSGGGASGGNGGNETLANEPGGDTPPDDANLPEEEIVADNTTPDGTEDGSGPPADNSGPSDDGSAPENEGQPDDGQQAFNGPSSDGPPDEDISDIQDIGDYYPEETLTVDDEGVEDEISGGNRVMADVMSVPEPGAASILVLGILGALGLARSRKNRN